MNQETLFFVIAKKKRKEKTNQQAWSKIARVFCSKYCLNTVGFANTSVYYVQFSAMTNTLFLSAKT
jgi:hypothetical protein